MKLTGIRARIFFAVTIPLTLAVSTVGGWLLSRHVGDIEQHHIEQAIALTHQAAILAELPLATGSTASAKSVIDFIERNDGFVGISLVDREGRTLDNRGNVGAAAMRLLASRPVSLMIERDAQLLYVVQPVVLAVAPPTDSIDSNPSRQAQQVGYVALTVSRTQKQATVARLWATGASVLVAALGLSWLLAGWVARSVSQPMVRLTEALSAVAKGDLDIRLAETGRGQLQRIAQNFNHMSSALALSKRGLQGEITRATEALARRTHEAESASLAKSRYLAAASHDLRQPAHALSLYLTAAKRIAQRIHGEPAEQMHAALTGMEASAQTLDALLSAVLDISRIEAGVMRSAPEPLAIQAVFERVIAECAESARANSASAIALRFRPTSLGVYADPVQFARICQNLVSNALKFSRRGTVLLTARARGDSVLVQVWDQGQGIAAEHADRVFEEFFQVAESAIQQARGMGLGLAIVRRLCEVQGGSITMKSSVGRGSVFSILLPQTQSTYRFQIRPSKAEGGIAAGNLALILDDEASVRDATTMVLSQAGYQVISADSELAANALLQNTVSANKPLCAAVIDYRLANGYTGIDAANRLRLRFGTTLKIVIVTGDTSPERLQELHESAFLVLHKPAHAEQLVVALSGASAAKGP